MREISSLSEQQFKELLIKIYQSAQDPNVDVHKIIDEIKKYFISSKIIN
ncbi:hypothetical protein ACLM5H_01880 [Fredinandcohnia humi]